jgi:DNA repair ATPase RecN
MNESQLHNPPATPQTPGPVEHLLRGERLTTAYRRAIARGDAVEAERLARQMRDNDDPELQRLAALSRQVDRPQGRNPNPGEEDRLGKSLARVESEAARLEAQKAKLLKRVADGPDGVVFSRLREVDGKLRDCNYHIEAIRAELRSFEDWRASEAREQRVRAEIELRERREAERKRKIAELDALAKETARHWEEVVRGLSAIESKAKELGESESRWHDDILKASGARESPAMVCGLPNPWVFPNPSLERGE